MIPSRYYLRIMLNSGCPDPSFRRRMGFPILSDFSFPLGLTILSQSRHETKMVPADFVINRSNKLIINAGKRCSGHEWSPFSPRVTMLHRCAIEWGLPLTILGSKVQTKKIKDMLFGPWAISRPYLAWPNFLQKLAMVWGRHRSIWDWKA